MNFPGPEARKILKNYLSYLSYLFFKKVFLFGFAVYFAERISVNAVFTFILFCFNYLSVYFGNDLIDRRFDKDRKFLLDYKLRMSERTLFYLFISHLIIPFAILSAINPRIAIVSFLASAFGVVRSYFRKPAIREFTLFLLQIIQLFLMFDMLGAVDEFVEHIFLITLFSLMYTVYYYFHKIPEKGEVLSKTIAYILLCIIVNVFALAEVEDIITLLYAVGVVPGLVYTRRMFVGGDLKTESFKKTVIAFHLLGLFSGALLMALGLLHAKIYLNICNTQLSSLCYLVNSLKGLTLNW